MVIHNHLLFRLQFWEPEYHETLDLGSQVGLGQRFAVAPSPRVTSLNWAMRKLGTLWFERFPKMGMPPNHPELDQGLKPMTWGSATEKTAAIRASALGRSQRGPGQCQVALGADFGLGRSTRSWQAKHSFLLVKPPGSVQLRKHQDSAKPVRAKTHFPILAFSAGTW